MMTAMTVENMAARILFKPSQSSTPQIIQEGI